MNAASPPDPALPSATPRLTPAVHDRDHVQGDAFAAVTLVEYGDYECPYCGRAHPIVRRLQRRFGARLRFVFRNFPLVEIHPHAMHAAESAEWVASVGGEAAYWAMHDQLLEHQGDSADPLGDAALGRHASAAGVDPAGLGAALRSGRHAAELRESILGGVRSGVTGTPTFFVNGIRYDAPVDEESLASAIEAAEREAGRPKRSPLAITLALAACGFVALAGAVPAQQESAMTGTAARSAARPAAESEAIRSFRIAIPDADLADLRRRLAATRWPDRETIGDPSQGAQLANVQELVRYWGTDYDWRRGEARLNALPQFVTTIDGVDIHFIHVRSRHPNALPLVIAHGWPGSVFEQIKLIGPLTDPTKYGGRAEDAFDVVIPSLPGYGFSGRPTEAGWGLEHIGAAFGTLMTRLGYTRYVAQGGDWGAGIVQAMGREAPAGLLGIHTNLPAAIPDDVGPALGGGPLPAGISAEERATVESLRKFLQGGNLAYVGMMNARPQAVGYGLTDSPAGLAGFMLVHPGFAHWSYGRDPAQSPTRDDVLDDFTLYWLTNSSASAARIYWENRGRNLTSASAQMTDRISVPVAVTVFPDEVYQPPKSWAERAFPRLIYYNAADRGGHFAAWEYPELFAKELRAAFGSLR